MSLGGDADDGSHPLAAAVNELSATSDTLFVDRRRQRRRAGRHRHRARRGRRGADRRRRRRRRRDGRLLEPRPAAPRRRPQARGRRSRRRHHRRPRRRHRRSATLVDELYTTISGTSMATPHVAGLAAILKEEHPQLGRREGSRRPSRNSTVPVADATGFDAGTGRVDARRRSQRPSLASASLDLGYYTWPQTDLPPTRHDADLHEHG